MIGSRSAAKRAAKGSLPLTAERLEYVFGPYRLDTGREILKCGNRIIPLPKRLFAMLQTLIEADGNVVTREELASLIWPDGNMAGWNLSQHIYMLRQILGESARDRQFIMTVHGNGFRFAAQVTRLGEQTQVRPASRDADSAGENPLQSGYDAFACYSRASALMERPTAAALSSTIEYLNAALAIDARFAPALVGAARAYSLLAHHGYATGDWALTRAQDYIDRALSLNPTSASAHAVNAGVTLLARWDFDAAKRSIDTAIELNSESALVRGNAACLYAHAGDYQNASVELEKALLHAPYSLSLQFLLGRLLVLNQEYERAIEHFSNLLEIDEDFSLARDYRAEAQIHVGRPQDAVLSLLCVPGDPREDFALRLPLLCRAYADAGEKKQAEAAYERLLSVSQNGFVPLGRLATCAIGLERYDEALDHLNRAVADREPTLLLLRLSPWFGRVASSEPFKRVLQAIKPRTYQ